MPLGMEPNTLNMSEFKITRTPSHEVLILWGVEPLEILFFDLREVFHQGNDKAGTHKSTVVHHMDDTISGLYVLKEITLLINDSHIITPSLV